MNQEGRQAEWEAILRRVRGRNIETKPQPNKDESEFEEAVLSAKARTLLGEQRSGKDAKEKELLDALGNVPLKPRQRTRLILRVAGLV